MLLDLNFVEWKFLSEGMKLGKHEPKAVAEGRYSKR